MEEWSDVVCGVVCYDVEWCGTVVYNNEELTCLT